MNKRLMSYPVFNSVANELSLPRSVRYCSFNLYQECLGMRLSQGRRLELIVGACVILCSKLLDYPINLKRLCSACDCSKSDLFRNLRFINKFLKLKALISPEAYVSRYCYELGLSEDDKTLALKKLKRVNEVLINKSSSTRAAVSVYLAGRASYRKLSRVSGLSKTHLNNCVKKVFN
ncbi:hypothetical protein GF352_00860 [archaeon]|nr:hypothetical protein [archaeon]